MLLDLGINASSFSLLYDHVLPPLLQVLNEPSSTREFTTKITFITNQWYCRHFFLLAIIMESGSNPSVGWPGFKMAATRHTKDTFEMSALYYMVQGLYEPYVSCSQVLSWGTGSLSKRNDRNHNNRVPHIGVTISHPYKAQTFQCTLNCS